ncbi:MAG: hypothetical protein ACI35O_15880 [Bacillaceae bacterium]
MKEEIAKVLTMMQEGKIDAEKGAELITLMNQEEKVKQERTEEYFNKKLRVQVLSGEDEVNVNVPLKLIKVMIGATKDFLPSLLSKSNIDPEVLENIDFNLILHALENEVDGPLVDIKAADGEIVKITIE